MPDRVDARSLDVASQRRAELKALFPSAFTETRDEQGVLRESVDFEKLKAELGTFSDVFENRRERYGMDWPGKKDCLKVIQQPSHATLKPCREESVEFDSTENLFIEGDNLEVLKLLQKSYYGKVKMIYIDPPYNTGKEFIYPDNYGESLDTYLAYAGLSDSEGKKFATNTPNEGRFHTKWLNMMYPRLYLARNLLRDDGVIVISIDDNELSNLRCLCDEVFGQLNFLGCVEWNSTKSVTNTAIISVSHTHNLIYAKEAEYFRENRHHFRLPEDGNGFDNPDGDPRGPWKADPFQVGGVRPNQLYEITNPNTGERYVPNRGCSWKNEFTVFQQLMADNRIVFGVSGEAGPQRKRFLSDAMERGKVAKTLWDDVGTTTNATKDQKELFGGICVFDNPKPVDLIQRFLTLGVHNPHDGIVLDFFAGSATTAHAVLDLNLRDNGNRRFTCVQLPETCDEECEGFKAGFRTIADIGKERIRRVIKKLNDEEQAKPETERSTGQDLGFRVLKLDRSNFRQWPDLEPDSPSEKIIEQLELHIDHVDTKASPEDLLFEMLIKAGLSPASKIETVELAGLPVFSVAAGRVLVCLADTVTQELIDAISKAGPEQFLCLDRAFHGNDQLRANTSQTFEARQNANPNARPIAFRTI